MRIPVRCPHCGNRWLLDPSLKGQQLRCPNALCRRVFEVREESEGAGEVSDGGTSPPSPKAGGTASSSGGMTGSVHELVPVLEAEAEPSWHEQPPPVRASSAPAEPVKPLDLPAPSPAKPSWDQPPPIRRTGQAPPEGGKSPILDPSVNQVPVPGVVEAPPVRPITKPEIHPPIPPSEIPGPAPGAEITRKSDRRRRNRWIMAALVPLVGGVIGLLAWMVIIKIAISEEQRFLDAQAAYSEGKFSSAQKLFQEIANAFPESQRVEEYQFLAGLSEARSKSTSPDVLEAFDYLLQFVQANEKNPLLEPHRKDIGKAFFDLALALAQSVPEMLRAAPDLTQATQIAAKAEQARALARKYLQSGMPSENDLIQALAEASQAIVKRREVEDALGKVRGFVATPENLDKAGRLFDKLGIRDLGEARELQEKLIEGILQKVSYSPLGHPPGPRGDPADGDPFLLVVTPPNGPPTKEGTGGVVYALARGVLYALEKTDGRVRWVIRLGVDISTLPVQVPGREMILVLSRGGLRLTARDPLDGREAWHHEFPSPCLARPILVGQLALVPSSSGTIFEIDIPTGVLRGKYDVGGRLSGGGVHDVGTDLVYIPADTGVVYALDVAQKKCLDILGSGHPMGSLRGEPLITGPEAISPPPAGEMATGQRYLVLFQSDGLESTKLRALRLPFGRVFHSSLGSDLTVPGWPWFPPSFNGETIALSTDAVSLALVGTNGGGSSEPLFHLIPPLGNPSSPLILDRVRPVQLVYAGEHYFWILSQGMLGQYRLSLDREKGLQLTSVRQPLALGSPLHSSQLDEATGVLFLVTSFQVQGDCLATAVNGADGRTLWQRRLGMIPREGPVELGDLVLTVDQGAGFWVFDPKKIGRLGPDGPRWTTGGEARPIPLSKLVAGPFLLPSWDGKSVLEIACVAKEGKPDDRGAYEMILRRFEPGQQVVETSFRLREPLAGQPGIGTDALILPLANGDLVRQPFEGTEQAGVSWRSPRASRTAAGHVVNLAPDRFLTTDGSRGLTRWRWPMADVPREEKTVEVTEANARLEGPPLVLAAKNPGDQPMVCVADSRGIIHLLRADDLTPVRRWDVKGSVTAGPFLRGPHIGCVVDRRRLVWLDSGRDSAVWEYKTESGDIVGRPQLVKGMVVVANLGNQIMGLDPTTGKRLGKTYALAPGLAAAASPVSFGPDRLFVPLIDGTVLLPSISIFR